MALRFLDTFAGVGGFHLGIKSVIPDAICVGAVEFDKTCQATYRQNFSITPMGDITTLDLASLPEHDLLTGGFPCQTFSRNGKFYNKNNKTLGEDGRSNLFLYLVSILKIKQPKYFVFENVKEIATIKLPDGSLFIDTLLLELRGAGYTVRYDILCPTMFGVPQQRKRMFFVGTRADLPDVFRFPLGEAPSVCISDVLDPTVPSKYLLSHLWRKRNNIKLPGTRLEQLEAAYKSGVWATPVAPTMKISPLAIIYGDTPSGLPRQQDKLYSVMGVCPTLATFSTPAVDAPGGWRLLTPRECFRLQSFPETYIIPPKDAAGYKQSGNAVNVKVVSKVIESLITAMLCNISTAS